MRRSSLFLGQGGGELAAEGMSGITEEEWVDNDTLYMMQQIGAVSQAV